MKSSQRQYKIRIKKLSLESKLLMMWFCELYALTIIRYILSSAGITSGMLRSIALWGVASIPIILFFVQIGHIEQHKYVGFFVLFFAIIISMVVSIAADPTLIKYFTRESYGIDRIFRPDCALYAFLFFSLFDDPSELMETVTAYAYLDFAYRVVVQLLPALARGYWLDIGPDGQYLYFSYNLSFGYAVTFPTIVFFYQFTKVQKKKKLISLLFALTGTWCVVTQGNRGALLVLIIFFGLMMISDILGKDNVSRKTMKIVGIFFVLLLIATVGSTLLDYGLDLLARSGISSRSLEKLLNGSFTDDNGRERIWLTVIGAIRTGGIWGHGMLGDRPYVTPLHVAGYSHNLFLELLASYGVIGAILIIYIFVDAAKMILLCKESNWREAYIIFFSVSCQLLLSMSFWYVWQFWAAAAIAYKYSLIKNKKNLW